ncbi:MAG: GNAT family N-acetyltransferase [Sphingobacteriaceae bacterium]|nr:GNAT family N-acetyltransferase [Sphingobacteriaceae bacterium]
MKNISYHKATNNDISTLVENRILFALELSNGHNPEAIDVLRTQMTAYFSKATADGTCISFIAKCDGIVGGIGSIHLREMPGNFKNPTGKWGYIMNMYTLPAFRRNGICKGILDLLVEEGTKYGVTAFELHATNEGELVYKQNGFVIHNEPTYRKFISK